MRGGSCKAEGKEVWKVAEVQYAQSADFMGEVNYVPAAEQIIALFCTHG